MFHPAAALRAGDMMNMFLADFKKLHDLVMPKKEELVKPDPKQFELV